MKIRVDDGKSFFVSRRMLPTINSRSTPPSPPCNVINNSSTQLSRNAFPAIKRFIKLLAVSTIGLPKVNASILNWNKSQTARDMQ